MRNLILSLICFVSFSVYAADFEEEAVLIDTVEAVEAVEAVETVETVETVEIEVQTGEVTIKSVLGTSLHGYVAGPEDAAVGILILHDRWGINGSIRQWVDRFAAKGYRALAIDVFDGRISNQMRLASEIMNATDPEWVKADVMAGLRYLKKGGRKVVTLGAGFGGWQSFQAAIAAPDEVAGTVVLYGELEADVEQMRSLKAPVLSIFARQDESITPPMIETYRLMMKKSLITYKTYSFPAGHGFMDSAYPAYNESMASDAWEQVDGFLADFVEAG